MARAWRVWMTPRRRAAPAPPETVGAYEALKPVMDAHVDADLGDSITFRLTAASAPLQRAPGVPTIPGFINLYNPEGGIPGMTPHTARWSCKVHKSFLPDGPSIHNRIAHPKLGGVTMRPATDTLDDSGDYYLFDLQAAL